MYQYRHCRSPEKYITTVKQPWCSINAMQLIHHRLHQCSSSELMKQCHPGWHTKCSQQQVRLALTLWTNIPEHPEECCTSDGDKVPDAKKTSWWLGKWAGLLVASLECDRRRKCTVQGA